MSDAFPLVPLPEQSLEWLFEYPKICNDGLVKEIFDKGYEWQGYAFSTPDIPVTRLLEFRSGGFHSEESPYRWPVKARTWLGKYFLAFARKYPNGICLAQDLCYRPEHFRSELWPDDPGYFLDNVRYYQAKAGETTAKQFEEIPLWACSFYFPYMAFFDTMERFVDLQNSVAFDDGLVSVITEAYDNEGYLLFKPQGIMPVNKS